MADHCRIGRAPGEAGAEAAHQNLVAAVDAACLHGFVERQRNAAGRRVAVAVEIDDDLAWVDAQGILAAVDDSQVGLVQA